MNMSGKALLLAVITTGWFFGSWNVLAGNARGSDTQNESRDPCTDGSQVTVQGVLEVEDEYGPTIFSGNHNVHWTMVTLKVSQDTSRKLLGKLKGCFDGSFESSRVQLWSGQKSMVDYRGKRVQITGLLMADMGDPTQILPMQLIVSHISLLQHSR